VFYVQCYSLDRPGPLWLCPACYRRGKLRIDEKVYEVAVADGDYDGRFVTTLSLPVANRQLPPGCDGFALDRDGDGKFRFSLGHAPEVLPLSRMVRIADKYYAVNLARDGSALELTATEPPLGRLALESAEAMLQLRLWSDAADQDLYRAARQWELPAGQYQALSATLQLKDSLRNDLALPARERLGPLGFFEINAGQTTRVRLGPPFVVTAKVTHDASNRVLIDPVITGCGGEEYGVDVQLNGRRLPAPGFRIVAEDGTVLVQDRFQYG